MATAFAHSARRTKSGPADFVFPGAKLSVYDGIGHSPFYEDAPRFNSELAAFVRAANKGN
jgi:non-heme chloroperoxidase